MTDHLPRCPWPGDDPLMIAYHDAEWGVPVHEDRKHFEHLILDAFQAGLSWRTILRRREGFRAAFAGFDPEAVAAFTDQDAARLLADPGIIRNRLKVAAAIKNAGAFLRVREEFGSFDAYVWRFVHGEPILNQWERLEEVPAESPEARALSKDLKARGFSFVGPTICYAYMQAAGLVNDHLVGCFRRAEVQTR